MWQRPLLRRHNTDPIDVDPPEMSSQLARMTQSLNLSSGSLSNLTQLTQGGLSFSSSNLRPVSYAANGNGNAHANGYSSSGMSAARSQSLVLQPSNGHAGLSAFSNAGRSASGRYHNETFRFPSVPEEGHGRDSSESGFASSFAAVANTASTRGRSHSNSVLGGMFASHMRGLLPPSQHPVRPSNNAAWKNGGAAEVVVAPIPVEEQRGSFLQPQPEATTPGPSELYRLVSAPRPDYPAILDRCRSHPAEACSFSWLAGCGHVYALHRLLRREDDEGGDKAPCEVVEGVMRACPRAVVRKQAVREEDDFMEENTQQQQQQQQQNLHRMNPHPPRNQERQQDQHHHHHEEENDEDPHNPRDTDADPDDVRYEYPLSIAAEYNHSPQIIRLLAKSTTESPHYRAEVYRSLDYASLSHETVRILLEEYAGCVLERGDSGDNEGDDDDCPLEKVLFWWDDPDVTGLEEDIATYPDCEMKDDLSDLWEKLRMMLYTATNKTMDGYDTSKEDFKVLHLLLRIVVHGGMQNVSFPNDFTHAVLLLSKFIQRERVGMFRERDEMGSLPLHIAVLGQGLLRCDMGSREKLVEGDQPREDDDHRDELERNDDVEMGEVPERDDRENQPLDGNIIEPLPQREERALGNGDDDNQHHDPDDDADDIDESDIEEDDHEASSSSVSCGMEIIKLLLEQHPASIRLYDTQTRSLPIHLVLKHNPHAIEAIDYFLRLYPKSATMPDGDGRLPLHIALLHNSSSWGQILELAPNTLERKDPKTGLFPFQLAALANSNKNADETHREKEVSSTPQDLDSLTTCFRLLRMNPHLASGLAEASTFDSHPADQRVDKLKEENTVLRQRIQELENQLLQMQLLMQASNGSALKKRKSFNAMDYFNGN